MDLDMSSSQQIVGVYLELVKRPYYFIVHSRLSSTHERLDRYAPAKLANYLVELLGVLSNGRPEFMRQFAALDDREFMKSSQHRRYVAKERDVLYINSPHLATSAVQFQGYWLGTNVSHSQVESVARLACEAAGVRCESVRKLPSFAGGA